MIERQAARPARKITEQASRGIRWWVD